MEQKLFCVFCCAYIIIIYYVARQVSTKILDTVKKKIVQNTAYVCEAHKYLLYV